MMFLRNRQRGGTKAMDSRLGAFTLIELLVVVAVIALLAALLLPALAKAKERALTVACISNLKQLEIAYLSYAHDHDDWLAVNDFVYFVGGGGSSFGVQSGVSWCPGDVREDTSVSNLTNGVLWPYNTSAGIYHCPADKSTVADTGILRTRSYNLSIWLGSTQEVRGYFRWTEIQNFPMDRVFTFIDTHEDAIVDPTFGVYPADDPVHVSYRNAWLDQPANRHSQGANIAFLDGHVEHWRWRAPKKFTSYYQPATGADLLDLRQLQACIPPARVR